MELFRGTFILEGRRTETALKSEIEHKAKIFNIQLFITKVLKGTQKARNLKHNTKKSNYYLFTNNVVVTIVVITKRSKLPVGTLTIIYYTVYDELLLPSDCPIE